MEDGEYYCKEMFTAYPISPQAKNWFDEGNRQNIANGSLLRYFFLLKKQVEMEKGRLIFFRQLDHTQLLAVTHRALI